MMKVHDFDVSDLVRLTPKAKKGGGFNEGYAHECICMFAQDDVDLAMLRIKVLLELAGTIGKVIPLDNDGSFGWDDAHTMMVLIASNRRGIIELEQGLHNPSSNQNDCFYIRFCGFKSRDVPISGSSRLVVDVSNAIKGMWPDTKIMPDTDRKAHSWVAPTQQAAASSTGGQQEFLTRPGVINVDATQGDIEETRSQVEKCQRQGIAIEAVVLTKCGLIDDEDLIEMEELETRDMLNSYGFDGDNVPIVRSQ